MFQKVKIKSRGSPPADYHLPKAARGESGYVVSSSMLRLFAQCPARWRAGYVPPESEAKRFGSLLDCRLLTPRAFAGRFAVKPETYPDVKTGEAKPFNANSHWCRQWLAEHAGKDICSAADVADVDAAILRLRRDEIIAALLKACDMQVWIAGEWKDERTGLTVPVQALVDLAPRPETEFARTLADLKCVRSGAPAVFQRQVYQLGWHMQAAFYIDLYTAATEEERCHWCFVGVENYAPWEPFRRMLSEDFLNLGRQTYQQALQLYARCLASGEWPGYDDYPDSCSGWSLLPPLPWMEFESQERAMAFGPEEMEPST